MSVSEEKPPPTACEGGVSAAPPVPPPVKHQLLHEEAGPRPQQPRQEPQGQEHQRDGGATEATPPRYLQCHAPNTDPKIISAAHEEHQKLSDDDGDAADAPPEEHDLTDLCSAPLMDTTTDRRSSPQHQYQVVSLSQSLAFSPAAFDPVTPEPRPRLTPVGGAYAGEGCVRMLEALQEENQRLRRELERHQTGKLRQVEEQVRRLSGSYEALVTSTAQRETLERSMRSKLEAEIRRLHDFNRDLRDRLETANQQLAERKEEEKRQWRLSLRRESGAGLEALEAEAAHLRSVTEEQRRHLELLQEAVSQAQSRAARLEQELGRSQQCAGRVERLQQALEQLQEACEKREQLERRLRGRLERELQRGASPGGVCSLLTAASSRRDDSLHPSDQQEALRRRPPAHDMEKRMKELHAQLLEKDAMIKVLQHHHHHHHRSRRDPAALRPSCSAPSITYRPSGADDHSLSRSLRPLSPPQLSSSSSLVSGSGLVRSGLSSLSASSLTPPSSPHHTLKSLRRSSPGDQSRVLEILI